MTFNGKVFTDTKTEAIPKLIYGDVNLDGVADILDVTAVQRHLAGIETLSDKALGLADANGDGSVKIDDVTHLQTFLAGYPVTLGPQA